MTIKKFLHSCILLEKDGKRLLIDPGEFCFVEGKIQPEDIPLVDIILLTHEHSDHVYPEALKKILKRGAPTIVTHDQIHKLLLKEGISSKIIAEGEEQAHAGFSIKAIFLRHGLLPVPEPKNFGYLIDDTFLHPGDSLTFGATKAKILALPIAAPWLTVKEAIEAGMVYAPAIAIPIHDAIMKDFMLSRMYSVAEKRLSEKGIVFKPLQLNDTLTI